MNISKKLLIGGICFLALVVMVGRHNVSTKDTPPTFTVEISKLQGRLGSDASCRIPGMLEFTAEDVENYRPRGGIDASRNELTSGIHLYYAERDMTVKQIIDSIVPIEGNKILFAFYNYGINYSPKGFYLYPEVAGNFAISDPNTFEIPAYHAFTMIACEDSAIWNILNETNQAAELYENLADLTDGWILIPATAIENFREELEWLKNRVRYFWVQEGPGFDFRKIEDIDEFALVPGYSMVWLKFDQTLFEIDEALSDLEGVLEEEWNRISNALGELGNSLDRLSSDALEGELLGIIDLIENSQEAAGEAYETFEDDLRDLHDPAAIEVLALGDYEYNNFIGMTDFWLEGYRHEYREYLDRMEGYAEEAAEDDDLADFIGKFQNMPKYSRKSKTIFPTEDLEYPFPVNSCNECPPESYCHITVGNSVEGIESTSRCFFTPEAQRETFYTVRYCDVCGGLCVHTGNTPHPYNCFQYLPPD